MKLNGSPEGSSMRVDGSKGEKRTMKFVCSLI